MILKIFRNIATVIGSIFILCTVICMLFVTGLSVYDKIRYAVSSYRERKRRKDVYMQ